LFYLETKITCVDTKRTEEKLYMQYRRRIEDKDKDKLCFI
jgi:hypothetical protein